MELKAGLLLAGTSAFNRTTNPTNGIERTEITRMLLCLIATMESNKWNWKNTNQGRHHEEHGKQGIQQMELKVYMLATAIRWMLRTLLNPTNGIERIKDFNERWGVETARRNPTNGIERLLSWNPQPPHIQHTWIQQMELKVTKSSPSPASTKPAVWIQQMELKA